MSNKGPEPLRSDVARVLRAAYLGSPEARERKPPTSGNTFDDIPDNRKEKWLLMADAAIEECFKDIG